MRWWGLRWLGRPGQRSVTPHKMTAVEEKRWWEEHDAAMERIAALTTELADAAPAPETELAGQDWWPSNSGEGISEEDAAELARSLKERRTD